jgi:hypothetical protein
MLRSTSRWMAATFAVAALPGLAWAHDWQLDGTSVVGQTPPLELLLLGITEVYEVSVPAGRSAELLVKDTQGCKAFIVLETTTGASAEITPQGTNGLTFNRAFQIKTKTPGTFEAVITVEGESVSSGMGSCLEDSKNLLRIVTTADPVKADLDYLKAWKPFSKDMRLAVGLSYTTAASEIKTTLGGIKDGSVGIEAGMMSIYRSAHSALVDDQEAISTALSGYRALGVDRLTAGGFQKDCEPRGFGAGAGGGWDAALRDSYLTGFGGLQRIDASMIGARKYIDKLTDTGKLNARVAWQPGYLLVPTYTPPSLNPEPGAKPRNELQIQAFGGVSFQDGWQVEACFWAGGRYTAASGIPNATLTSPSGATLTKPVVVGPKETWGVQFDGLTAGLTYRLGVDYPAVADEPESCVLSFPWLEVNPDLVPMMKR